MVLALPSVCIFLPPAASRTKKGWNTLKHRQGGLLKRAMAFWKHPSNTSRANYPCRRPLGLVFASTRKLCANMASDSSSWTAKGWSGSRCERGASTYLKKSIPGAKSARKTPAKYCRRNRFLQNQVEPAMKITFEEENEAIIFRISNNSLLGSSK